jgi:hypothetical protein
VRILFAAAAAEAFDELPQATKRKSASSIELLDIDILSPADTCSTTA